MYLILEVLITVLFIEATTNILTKSEIFEPVRGWLFKQNNRVLKFVHRILDCPYCTSVWVGLFSVTMLYLYTENALPQILTFFFIGIVLHRLANIVHFIIDRIDSNHQFGQG